MAKKRKTKIVFDERAYNIFQEAAEKLKSLPLEKMERTIKDGEKPLAELKKFRARGGLFPFEKIVDDYEDVAGKTEDNVSKALLLDDNKNVLYFSKNNKITLENEEIKLIKYMRKQESFHLEQILTEHFKIEITETFKHQRKFVDVYLKKNVKPPIEKRRKPIPKGDRNKFDVYKSEINRKCTKLSIRELIQKVKGEIGFYRLTRNIEIRNL